MKFYDRPIRKRSKAIHRVGNNHRDGVVRMGSVCDRGEGGGEMNTARVTGKSPASGCEPKCKNYHLSDGVRQDLEHKFTGGGAGYSGICELCGMKQYGLNDPTAFVNIVDKPSPEASMGDEIELTFDARTWAKGFNQTLVKRGYQPHDEGWLISWFANAIMKGYDEHAQRKPEASMIEVRRDDLIEVRDAFIDMAFPNADKQPMTAVEADYILNKIRHALSTKEAV